MSVSGKLAILVGGGPAPGINSVISAATIKARNEGFEVVGIQDGFKHLVKRDPACARSLAIGDVSRLHWIGGSVLGTARENPTKSEESMAAVVETLKGLGVTHLVTIGGDDTALSSAPTSARCTCPRRLTTICRCRRTSRLSGSKRRGTSACSWCKI
jgi:ATP-dependent phosphofructokinase / diphosphate-dependent phosphofructokinase